MKGYLSRWLEGHRFTNLTEDGQRKAIALVLDQIHDRLVEQNALLNQIHDRLDERNNDD